jgi:hypothetical protein
MRELSNVRLSALRDRIAQALEQRKGWLAIPIDRGDLAEILEVLTQLAGFTYEDVAAITRCLESDVWITVSQFADAQPLESIRDRIASLLPPRTP